MMKNIEKSFAFPINEPASQTITPEPNQSTGTMAMNHSDYQMNVWVENRYHKWRSPTAGLLPLIKLPLSQQNTSRE